MSRLSRWQVDALPDEDFAVLKPVRLSPVLDFEDAKHAWSRASFSNDPLAVRRRVIDICLRKGIKLTPAMGAQAIADEVAAHNASQGAGDSTNSMTFKVSSTADVARACEQVKQRLEEKSMSTQTFQQRHDTPQGQSALQQIHDIAARYGAVCKKPANLSAAEFVSKHESAKLQEAHDLAVSGGAHCNQQGTSPFFSGSQPTLRDPKERAREYAERRNRQIRGEGAATPQAKLSEPASSSDQMEAARERARAAARKNIEKRNRQIEQRREDIKEGRDPFHWRQR